ncbi:MAG: NADPH:quinone reductase [Planctomycetota bacterium]|nr:MAG: NADPH:quinone reductase [Planctomycetota bacterium]
MKAAYIERTGPPEVIVYGDLPDPTPGDDQVLVRVEAVSLNPVDTYIRAGTIPFELPKPFVVGCDLAGTVEAVGKNVTRFKPGDRVWGSNQGLLGRQGTFSELAAVDECWLYPIPEGVSAQDAAAISLVGITAHLGLFRDAQLKAGEVLYVHGGTGGVGSCVVQMGKAAGATVITSAGSAEKAARCRELGADHVILYKEENEAEALERIAPEGVDVWYETLREQDFDLIVSHLRPRGRIVVMAGRDARPPFPVGPFYVKDCKMFGFAMFNAPPEEQERCAQDINRWMVEGKLKPTIGRVMKLSETAEAHRLQEDNTLHKAGTLQGKIVLVP